MSTEKSFDHKYRKPTPVCKHCKNLSAKYPHIRFDHWLRESPEPTSRIVCPQLKDTECTWCGYEGHTKKYCKDFIRYIQERNGIDALAEQMFEEFKQTKRYRAPNTARLSNAVDKKSDIEEELMTGLRSAYATSNPDKLAEKMFEEFTQRKKESTPALSSALTTRAAILAKSTKAFAVLGGSDIEYEPAADYNKDADILIRPPSPLTPPPPHIGIFGKSFRDPVSKTEFPALSSNPNKNKSPPASQVATFWGKPR